ncbi:MAG: DUF481 domain-containing protein [Chlorobium sp.]|nr:DUF481 domain-containing protein [Chlorobium phaeovibrioides]NQU45738.1 DUF481 domain-containing protein [Chlorobium sp.]
MSIRLFSFPFISTLLLALFLCTTPQQAVAIDKIMLENGDRISGSVVRMEKGVLQVQTEYAGTLFIAWNKISEISSDSPMRILMKEGGAGTVMNITAENRTLIQAVNPDAWQTGDGHLFKGEAAISLNIDRGNTRQEEADLDVAIEWRHLNHRIKLQSELEYDTAENEKTTDRWFILAKYDNIVSSLRYYGGKVSYKTDRIADLNLRLTAGPYLGIQFINTPVTKLSTELGVDGVRESFDALPENTYLAGSWSVDFSHTLIADALQFYHRQKGLANVNNLSGVVLDTWTGLKIPVRGGFSTSAELKAEYSGDAMAGTDPWDLAYRLKFGYLW